MRRPVPEMRSSGNEYPMNPSRMARISMMVPMTQLSSRGLRKAPVKKTRAMWTTMEPTKMSAAQWCIWRTSSPPRTPKEMLTVELNASDTRWPRSGV